MPKVVALKKLWDAIDETTRSKGTALARRGGLLFAHLDDTGRLSAVFSTPKTDGTRLQVDFSEDPKTQIHDMDSTTKTRVAAAVFLLSLHAPRHLPHTPSPAYGGLTGKPERGRRKTGDAELAVGILNAPPHAPSKWERCRLEVSLSTPSKEYSGNLGNLRQLHFHGGVGASTRTNDFSPQERQIIRFLAINAEPDGMFLDLSAETMAEFMHCLAGFERVTLREKGKGKARSARDIATVHVYSEPASIILAKGRNGAPARPGLATSKGLLPLKNASMVLGRSGLWVGIANDYWWVPATTDLALLRNAVVAGSIADKLSPEQETALAELETVNAKLPTDIRRKHCSPIYDASPNDSGGITVSLKFIYGNNLVNPAGSNIKFSKEHPWKRDTAAEKRFTAELLAAGFAKKSGGTFDLEGAEAAGTFLDTLARQWFQDPEKSFSAEFASIAHGGNRIPPLLCEAQEIERESGKDFLAIRIGFIPAFGIPIPALSWKEILQRVKSGASYIIKDKAFFQIPKRLSEFVLDTADFTSKHKTIPDMILIPTGAAGYWREKLALASEAQAPFIGTGAPSPRTSRSPSPTSEWAPPKSFKGVLRPYQAEAVEWSRKMFDKGLNVILADEMGLGKTIQTIALACSLADDGKLNGPSMILCPSSLIDNWNMELEKFAPDLKRLPLKTGAEWDKTKVPPDGTLIISSYAMAARKAKKLAKIEFDLLALDEAQHIKNASTTNAKTAKSLRARQKIVLTGTPLENRPEELWSIFDFLHPGALGNLNSFKKRYANILEQPEAKQDLAARTAPFIMRRRKCEVEPDLPAKTAQIVPCHMTPEQTLLYEKERKNGLERLCELRGGKSKSRFEILANLTRLRQLCCHPALLPGNAGENVDSAKTDLLKELLLECVDGGHKTLVFSQFTSFLDIFDKWLDSQGIPFARIDGKTKARQDIVNNFNSENGAPVFLLSLKVGGVGFNLVSADRVIIYDPWWNPAAENQATDRTHRIGQTKDVHCMKLVVENSIETKILDLQEKKRRLFKALVDDRPTTTLKDLSYEDLEFLLE